MAHNPGGIRKEYAAATLYCDRLKRVKNGHNKKGGDFRSRLWPFRAFTLYHDSVRICAHTFPSILKKPDRRFQVAGLLRLLQISIHPASPTFLCSVPNAITIFQPNHNSVRNASFNTIKKRVLFC